MSKNDRANIDQGSEVQDTTQTKTPTPPNLPLCERPLRGLPAYPTSGEEQDVVKPGVTDQYHGQGGSYVVDDATQTRRPNKATE